jgi:S-DNA-T family DNA segregation ATPase FtsK/SpoIIIE
MVIATPLAEIPPDDRTAPPILLLPARINHDDVIERASGERAGGEPGAGILLGVEERRLRSVAVDFARHSHLVILGDTGCGKSATLRTLCREIVRTTTATHAQLLIVDYRCSLLGVIESHPLGGYASSPPALDVLLPGLIDLLRRRMAPPDASQAQLRARSRWSKSAPRPTPRLPPPASPTSPPGCVDTGWSPKARRVSATNVPPATVSWPWSNRWAPI